MQHIAARLCMSHRLLVMCMRSYGTIDFGAAYPFIMGSKLRGREKRSWPTVLRNLCPLSTTWRFLGGALRLFQQLLADIRLYTI